MNLATKRRGHYDLVTARSLHYNTCKGATMTANTPSITSFPPRDLADFLDLCTGRWMSLRSRFEPGGAGTEWHRSQHGYINVTRIAESAELEKLGGLVLEPPEGLEQQLHFFIDGSLNLRGACQASGAWNFRPDSNLELSIWRDDGGSLTEWIWFTKPNLRLRSTMATTAAGVLEQASFASEIRRIS